VIQPDLVVKILSISGTGALQNKKKGDSLITTTTKISGGWMDKPY
jgi:hypothetical protein